MSWETAGKVKHTVNVHGKPYEVSIHRKSKSVFEAVGNYTDVLAVPNVPNKIIRVTDRSEAAALKKWVETARYWGN
jgi:hypothetical protein